jgi:hypothetical protein
MTERLFVLYKLKKGVTREEYAKWIREEHFPWGRSVPSQINLRGFFVMADYDQSVKEPEWDNISIIDIENRQQWYKDMENDPHAPYHWEKWGNFVERYKIFFTEPIRA